jgi:translation initiation factor 2B subunit (eIF-2B alpha/beta/delta family)
MTSCAPTTTTTTTTKRTPKVVTMTHRDLSAQQTASDRLDAYIQQLTGLADTWIAGKPTAADLRELIAAIHAEVADIISDVETERDELQTTVRDATELIDLAIIHHDDAETFGWTDRDTEAWRLIIDAQCDLSDLIPVSA